MAIEGVEFDPSHDMNPQRANGPLAMLYGCVASEWSRWAPSLK